jgi:Tfp pilus assembly protein PilV
MIELLISLTLASIGLMGLLALQVTATRGNASSREFIEAVSIAQERLEAIEIEPYATIANLAEGGCAQDFSSGSPATISGSPTAYSRCTNVSVNGTITYVKVMVQWTDYNNVGTPPTHSITVQTTRSP